MTARLVKLRINVDQQYINVLPMETPVEIEGTIVTLTNANHCPGVREPLNALSAVRLTVPCSMRETRAPGRFLIRSTELTFSMECSRVLRGTCMCISSACSKRGWGAGSFGTLARFCVPSLSLQGGCSEGQGEIDLIRRQAGNVKRQSFAHNCDQPRLYKMPIEPVTNRRCANE